MFNEKKYRETFAQVKPSEETLSEVLKMTKKKHNGVRVTRMLAAAVIMTALLATTAFAYVGFTQYENPMEMLKTFFGEEETVVDEGTIIHYEDEYYSYDYQMPTVENIPLDEAVAESQVAPFVSDVGESITSSGWTLTVEAHLYDSTTDCGVIYYTLENPDGVDGYELQYDGEIWWPGGERVRLTGAAERSYLIEEESTDTKLTIAMYYCGAYEEEFISIGFCGNDNAALTLALNDGGGMSSITLDGADIAVSPLAMRLVIEDMDFLRQVEEYDGSLTDPLESNIDLLAIRYKDGTEYIVQSEDPLIDNTMYVLVTHEGRVVSYLFNRVIDINEVEAILINDVEYTDIQNSSAEQRGRLELEDETAPVATEPANP